MNLSYEQIREVSDETGFRPFIVEKVIYLLHLLNMLNSHPILKGKLALKGGTALNLFVFNAPRMSVDIDFNYIGELDREAMLEDRPKIEKAMCAVFQREGFLLKRMPSEHAGGKWRVSYSSYTGEKENLEVDINFVFRQPLWDVKVLDSHLFGKFQALKMPVFDAYELYAGKLAALFSREQARDLFDSYQLLHQDSLDQEKLRLAFVVYGAMNRKDWRKISFEDISFSVNDLKQKLLPVLIVGTVSEKDLMVYGQTLVKECTQRLSVVYPLTEKEIKFFDYIVDKGEIEPSLLTKDADLQARIINHPGLLWKALNVRKNIS